MLYMLFWCAHVFLYIHTCNGNKMYINMEWITPCVQDSVGSIERSYLVYQGSFPIKSCYKVNIDGQYTSITAEVLDKSLSGNIRIWYSDDFCMANDSVYSYPIVLDGALHNYYIWNHSSYFATCTDHPKYLSVDQHDPVYTYHRCDLHGKSSSHDGVLIAIFSSVIGLFLIMALITVVCRSAENNAPNLYALFIPQRE